MRIGLVIENFAPHRGGAEQWTYQFAERLLRRGHEVHVVASAFSQAGLQLPVVPHCVGKIRSRLAKAAALEAKLRQLSLDVIHDMGVGWYCDVFHSHDGSRLAQCEAKLAMLPGPVRPIKRALLRVLPRYREFEQLAARQLIPGRLVIALSEMVARDYQRYHHVAPGQIRLVHNGVDPERFSPASRDLYRETVRWRLGVDDRTLLLLIVAHNFPLKGVPTLLRAMRRLESFDAPVHLVVVGGKHAYRAAERAERSGFDRLVTFAGRAENVVPYYAAADVYVHPTLYDSFGLVLLEAMASGLPVVTSRRAGAAELLTEGREGFVLDDPCDDRQLADRVVAMLDAPRRRRMGHAARQLALQHTLERNCDQLIEIYHEAIRRTARPRRRSA